MKVKSIQHKGQRIFKTHKLKFESNRHKHKRPYWIEPVDPDVKFCLDNNMWSRNANGNNYTLVYYAMSHQGLKDFYSLKAVKNFLLRTTNEKGLKFDVRSSYVGADFIITT